MYFVQYFDSALSGKLIPACGDRAVVILDGRNRLIGMMEDARKFNGFRRPYYAAFQIWKGENILRSKPITDIIPL